jgi:predicted transcriptional regulator
MVNCTLDEKDINLLLDLCTEEHSRIIGQVEKVCTLDKPTAERRIEELCQRSADLIRCAYNINKPE